MKNFYDISKEQLYTMWAFGGIGLFASLGALDAGSDSVVVGVLVVAIPFFLFFYSFGWRDKHKKDKGAEI